MSALKFRAPWSKKLRRNTWLLILLLSAACVAGLLLADHDAVHWLLAIAPAVLLIAAFALSVRSYTLTDADIQIERYGL